MAEEALAGALALETVRIAPHVEVTNRPTQHLVHVHFPRGSSSSASDARVQLDDDEASLTVEGAPATIPRRELRRALLQRLSSCLDADAVEALTAKDLTPFAVSLLQEHGIRAIEYEPATIELPTDGSVDVHRITRRELDNNRLLITVPKTPPRRRVNPSPRRSRMVGGPASSYYGSPMGYGYNHDPSYGGASFGGFRQPTAQARFAW